MRATEQSEWFTEAETLDQLKITKRLLKTYRLSARLTFARIGHEIRYEKQSVLTLWDRNRVIKAI